MLPFGIELLDLLLFLRQFGLALAGASALWGFIFLYRSLQKEQSNTCLVLTWIAEKMFIPLTVGGAIAFLSWFLLTAFPGIYAHEGISLAHSAAEKEQAFLFTSPWFILWLSTLIVSFTIRRFWPTFFIARLKIVYAFHLLFVIFLMILPAFVDGFSFSRETLSTVAHYAHSILTLGTILILDFLFLYSQSSVVLKQHIYPIFPLLSKFIWVGLGIDFLSSALIFGDGVTLSAKFFFAQTIVAVLVLNGVLLGGPIGRMLMASVREGGKSVKNIWENIAHISGIISVSSWTAITFADMMGGLTLNYPGLFVLYGVFIAILVVFHTFFGRFAGEFLKEKLMSM